MSSPRRFPAVAAVVALGALLMLLPGESSLWLDETVSVAVARLGWRPMWSLMAEREANGGLYYVLLHAWSEVAHAELWLRALSIAAALATLVVTYLLARRLFGRRVGVVTAGLLAVNGLFLTEATEIRTYAVTTLLVTASCLLLAIALESASRRAWLGYAVVTALAFYGHLFVGFVFAGQICCVGLAARAGWRVRPAAWALPLAAALAAPIGAWAVVNGGQIGWIGRPTLEKVAGTVSVAAGGLAGARATAGVDRALGVALALLYAMGVAGAAVAAVRATRSGGRAGVWPWSFAGCLVAVPVAGALAVSVTVQPVFYYKYFSLIVPLLAILVGAGLVLGASRRIALGAVAAIVVLSVVATGKCVGDCNREDWKQATAYVARGVTGEDAVVVFAPYARTAFDYYAAGTSAATRVVYPAYAYTSPARDLVHDPTRSLVARIAAEHARVWLVLSHASIAGDFPGSRLTQWMTDAYGRPSERSFEGVRVLLFSR